MAYYDALKAKWATLAGTTDQKLTAINALTVPGPNADVAVSAVVGKLMLMGAFLQLQAFAQGVTNNDATHDNALAAAKMLMALVSVPSAPAFHTSDANDYATIKSMMDAILAQESAAPGSTGFTQSVHDTLLGLAATVVPWWQASVAAAGGGLTSPVNANDLVAAGGLS